MKKKFVLISLLLAITLSITACNQAEITSTEVSTENSMSESSSETEQSESNSTLSEKENSSENSVENSTSSETSNKQEISKNTTESSKTESKSESKPNNNTKTNSSSKPTNSSTTSSSTASTSPNTNSNKMENSSSSSNNSSKKPSNSYKPSTPSHTHSYTSKTVKATCTQDGYTVHTCACGASYTDNKTASLGHSWSDWKTVKKATSSAEGRKERSCSRCGKTESKSIAKVKGKYDVPDDADKASLVEERILYYVNKYRQEEGHNTVSRLTRMSKYSKYRSNQLVTNFAHDTNDIYAAANALKYGLYEEAPNGQMRYDPDCIEAIGLYPQKTTVDAVAKSIVDMFRNSPGHWGYVGGADDFYKNWNYIGIGCTCNGGNWYICITINNTDEYE